MERETGIEPATFSLGNRPSIENKEHCASGHLLLAMEFTGIRKACFLQIANGAQMEHRMRETSPLSISLCCQLVSEPQRSTEDGVPRVWISVRTEDRRHRELILQYAYPRSKSGQYLPVPQRPKCRNGQ
jgi:hypothetical protein